MPTREYKTARRKWVGARVSVFIRKMNKEKKGPYEGICKGLSDNAVAAEDEGSRCFDATGLLVEIPFLGRNETSGEWPVSFVDAEILEDVQKKQLR